MATLTCTWKVGREQDQRRAEDRPAPPGVRRIEPPEGVKIADAEREIDVEPDEGRRPEDRDADDRRRICGGWRQSDQRAELRLRRRTRRGRAGGSTPRPTGRTAGAAERMIRTLGLSLLERKAVARNAAIKSQIGCIGNARKGPAARHNRDNHGDFRGEAGVDAGAHQIVKRRLRPQLPAVGATQPA